MIDTHNKVLLNIKKQAIYLYILKVSNHKGHNNHNDQSL